MNPMLRITLLLACCLAVTFSNGQGTPSAATCRSRFESIGQLGLLSQLSSCQGAGSSPSSACCSAANGLLGYPGSGQLAGCLCTAEALEFTLSTIDSNSLAKSAGVGREQVKTVLEACKVPNVDLEGSCPSDDSSSSSSSDDGDKGNTDDKSDTKPAAKVAVTTDAATAATGYKHPFLAHHPILAAVVKAHHPLLGRKLLTPSTDSNDDDNDGDDNDNKKGDKDDKNNGNDDNGKDKDKDTKVKDTKVKVAVKAGPKVDVGVAAKAVAGHPLLALHLRKHKLLKQAVAAHFSKLG